MNKTRLLIFIIVMCPIILCGCWDYKETETLAIVAGVAIDKDIVTNNYVITTEIVTSETQGISSTISSQLYTSEGESLSIAVRNMVGKTGLKLFWSDAEVVVICEPIAMDGVIPVLDWLMRDAEPRPDILLLISKDTNAAEILKAKNTLSELTSFHLADAFKSQNTLSKLAGPRLWSFIDEISSEGKSTVVPTVKNVSHNNTIKSDLSGVAIFKRDILVGYLSDTETLYLSIIKNKLKAGLISLRNVSGTGTNVSLEIFENRTKVTPIYKNGVVSIVLDINMVVSINEIQGTTDFMKEENLKMLQTEAEEEIQSNVQNLIAKLQNTYNSDVLGFLETFNKEKPKESKILKKSGEDIFQSINTKINIHVQIKGSGKTIKPSYSGD